MGQVVFRAFFFSIHQQNFSSLMKPSATLQMLIKRRLPECALSPFVQFRVQRLQNSYREIREVVRYGQEEAMMAGFWLVLGLGYVQSRTCSYNCPTTLEIKTASGQSQRQSEQLIVIERRETQYYSKYGNNCTFSDSLSQKAFIMLHFICKNRSPFCFICINCEVFIVHFREYQSD